MLDDELIAKPFQILPTGAMQLIAMGRNKEEIDLAAPQCVGRAVKHVKFGLLDVGVQEVDPI
jgi:hypothetical protein